MLAVNILGRKLAFCSELSGGDGSEQTRRLGATNTARVSKVASRPSVLTKNLASQNTEARSFTEEQRDAIIAQFAKRSPFYVPFIHTLFWAGTTPSELLLDLCGGDVDLRAGFISITKSRYLNEGATKTVNSDRVIKLFLPSTVEALKEIKPLNVTDRNGRRIV